MKINLIPLIGFTTLILIAVTLFAAMDMSFSWLFFLTIFGQGLFVFTVYKVLTDDYKTNNTFEDFYEDRPDLGRK